MLSIASKISIFSAIKSSLSLSHLNSAFFSKTIFERIIDKKIPAKILYEDKYCCAINDINPQAPCHILLFPKNKSGLSGIEEANESSQKLLGHLLLTAAQIAKQQELIKGYRIIINQGEDGGQTVPHLHLHILGGRKLGITGFN